MSVHVGLALLLTIGRFQTVSQHELGCFLSTTMLVNRFKTFSLPKCHFETTHISFRKPQQQHFSILNNMMRRKSHSTFPALSFNTVRQQRGTSFCQITTANLSVFYWSSATYWTGGKWENFFFLPLFFTNTILNNLMWICTHLFKSPLGITFCFCFICQS